MPEPLRPSAGEREPTPLCPECGAPTFLKRIEMTPGLGGEPRITIDQVCTRCDFRRDVTPGGVMDH